MVLAQAVPDPPASAPTHQFTSQQVAQLRDLSATLTSSADAPAPAPTQRIFRDGAATAHTALAALSPSRAPASEFSVAQQQALAAVIEAYERGVQAPAQGIGAGQSRAARAEFAPAPAPANASGNASGSMTYPAQGPDPAQELTPAQRAAIKKVFSPPSAGKEDAGGDITYPAQVDSELTHVALPTCAQYHNITMHSMGESSRLLLPCSYINTLQDEDLGKSSVASLDHAPSHPSLMSQRSRLTVR